MAPRKEAKRRSLLQFLALIIAVVIVLVGVYLGQRWWSSRPGPEPQDVTVTATVGDTETEVSPYAVCELDQEDCPEGEIARVPVPADGEVRLKIPNAIHDHNWQLLQIYDDPAANEERSFGAYDEDSVTVQGSVDPVEEGENAPRPKLTVLEIHSVMIGTDDAGEETPKATVWSLDTTAE
ncbi:MULTISPECIES: DUF2771 domain-containing protein [Corynebacterium]|uniref:DUF2771 domain-containing protein n=1 Tax=Corynebacterium TaxID=1716 RepID=UPI00254FA32A|nr:MULTISPECIES: DUF2771 domain-containing protein [Corynebacterium]MDK6260291.1 DUF2771 domain-containing protein [Corynebacterium frankenforstense]MDK8895451.1 DUF2771 domain-containing protein [Corynebacterium sp. MSK006]